MKFNALMPEIYVTDFQKSFDFYTKILGFTLEYQRENPLFAFFSYGDAQFMIQQLRPGEKETMQLEHPFGRGMNFEIDTPSVTNLIASLKANNYPLARDIKESWRDIGNGILGGSQEILVHDPDGYILRFSQGLGTKDKKDI